MLAAGNGMEANRVGPEKVTASTMHQHQVVCVERTKPSEVLSVPTALLLLRVLTSVCCHFQASCVCVEYVKLIKWFRGI